ncbi:MAG: SpoIIE family protein phosphatase [Halothiobacillaceae bacterium]|nr:SpoIIE family protein phosphatase [Halothiobacillaceae bacterium]
MLLNQTALPSQATPLPSTALELKKSTTVASPELFSDDILHLFHEHPELDTVPVIEGMHPIGLINRHIFMNEMTRPFAREIYGRKSCIAFMDKHPLIIEETTPIQDLSFQVLAAGQKALSDGFIIVKNGNYTGVGSGFDLVDAVTKLQAEKSRMVMESIEYASVIQKSFLRPSQRELAIHLPDHLLHWEPRDVVGGDFFVFRAFDDGYFIAVIDCTGHGVPGAFMTLIMASFLDRILQHDNPRDPAEVMAKMNRMIKSALAQDGDTHHDGSDDGMDAAFMWFNRADRLLTWASAKTPLFMVIPPSGNTMSDTKIEQMNGERMGVGYRTTPMQHIWLNHSAHLAPGTSVFVTTDGFIDQPGGKKRIAFGKKRLKSTLLEHHALALKDQSEHIMQTFRAYQAEQTRRDDVTFFGFRP